MTEHSGPFLTKVNKNAAPGYGVGKTGQTQALHNSSNFYKCRCLNGGNRAMIQVVLEEYLLKGGELDNSYDQQTSQQNLSEGILFGLHGTPKMKLRSDSRMEAASATAIPFMLADTHSMYVRAELLHWHV